MKKSIFTLAAIAALGTLLTAADCLGSDSQVTACAEDTDCGEGEICSDEICITPQCEEDADCNLAGSSADNLRADECANCEEGTVCVVDFAGTTYCAVEEDAPDFVCEGNADLPAGTTGVEVELEAGGTVTVCVDNDDVCTDATCGAAG